MTPSPVQDVIVSAWLGPLMLGLGFVTVQGLWAEEAVPTQRWKDPTSAGGGVWKPLGRPPVRDWKEI